MEHDTMNFMEGFLKEKLPDDIGEITVVAGQAPVALRPQAGNDFRRSWVLKAGEKVTQLASLEDAPFLNAFTSSCRKTAPWGGG